MTSIPDNPTSQKIFKRTSLKRKLIGNSDTKPAKRRRTVQEYLKLDDLAWKEVQRPSAAGIDEAGGMLMLEEVDGVEVYYEETPKGKVAKFRQIIKSTSDFSQGDKQGEESDVPDDQESNGSPPQENDDLMKDVVSSLPEWEAMGLAPVILQQVHRQGFRSPTPIQRQTIPLSLAGRDVIGISQTGSGKTLAFALPILHAILSEPPLKLPKEDRRHLKALIITPTRELALQVSAHVNACTPVRTEKQVKMHAPPRVSLATIVGGMSIQKQARMLQRGVDIIVATPGRFWELVSEDDVLATQIREIRFFVIDEADRMTESGHFAELDKIIRLTSRPERSKTPEETLDGADTEKAKGKKMQTLVFSATMSKDLQRNLKRYKGSKPRSAAENTIEYLLSRLDFRDSEPAVIDLSPKDRLVPTFQESKVECLSTDKDVYLYYFLLRYPGRSLVFMSSIDGVRRLTPILELLQLKVWPLHSQMEQRQRLKNLDRFKSSSKCVLLATDIAARGLDVPFVDHVIHFQVPRSADVYIHRNGRTARAEQPGFGLLLCAPDEKKLLRALFKSLGRNDDEVLDLPVERDILGKLKHRIKLAHEIDKVQHAITKENHERSWLRTTADALEVELSDDSTAINTNKEKKGGQIKGLKRQLLDLLSQPLMARGISAKFITSGSRPVVDDMLRGETHEALIGLKIATAQEDLLEMDEGTKGKRVASVSDQQRLRPSTSNKRR